MSETISNGKNVVIASMLIIAFLCFWGSIFILGKPHPADIFHEVEGFLALIAALDATEIAIS